MCHFDLLLMSKKSCEVQTSWEGGISIAEEAGQKCLEEVSLELKWWWP